MKTLFSTTEVHPRHRFDYWHDVACKTLINHDSTPECRQTFRAELQVGALADIDLVLYESSPMYCSVTVRHVGHANAEELFIFRQLAGVLVLEQDSRDLVLEAGDITLLDPRLPMVGKYLEGSRQLILKVPRRQLEARVGNTRQMIARAIEAKVWPLVAAGKVRPVIDSTFPLAKAAAAHARMESSQHIGKIVLTV